jgi:hypothetical protein
MNSFITKQVDLLALLQFFKSFSLCSESTLQSVVFNLKTRWVEKSKITILTRGSVFNAVLFGSCAPCCEVSVDAIFIN